ncbi:hypothetical protein PSTG_06551 [Puccinia striiformis f. sp. tritici PST-78]|uniref:Uncharacterized protein n=1 Tax=Puccinia striiformis f. sp. tritici PST-78 TaxID=1165861 RepID=A0A0L0VLK2_9BASI|nr:hypothetical protein PSTG_06551 [Puccinia striiformis f. sp. tritici PST-78]
MDWKKHWEKFCILSNFAKRKQDSPTTNTTKKESEKNMTTSTTSELIDYGTLSNSSIPDLSLDKLRTIKPAEEEEELPNNTQSISSRRWTSLSELGRLSLTNLKLGSASKSTSPLHRRMSEATHSLRHHRNLLKAWNHHDHASSAIESSSPPATFIQVPTLPPMSELLVDGSTAFNKDDLCSITDPIIESTVKPLPIGPDSLPVLASTPPSTISSSSSTSCSLDDHDTPNTESPPSPQPNPPPNHVQPPVEECLATTDTPKIASPPPKNNLIGILYRKKKVQNSDDHPVISKNSGTPTTTTTTNSFLKLFSIKSLGFGLKSSPSSPTTTTN